jgi:hypothetical protein
MIRIAWELRAQHGPANKKITDAIPHMIYQNTFYKGLDVSRQK